MRTPITPLVNWRALIQRPWFWPLPAVLVHAWVLLTSSQVWTDAVTTHSRSGAASTLSVAERHLLLVAATCGGLLFTWLFGDILFLGGRRGMRTPTETEKGCAMALFRGGLLFVLYVSAYSLVRRY